MLGAYLGCDLMCTDVPIRVKNWLAENAPYIKVKYCADTFLRPTHDRSLRKAPVFVSPQTEGVPAGRK